jgi:protein N-terminal methyltransferase
MADQAPDSHISHADALAYWNNVAPTVDGMLGGFPQISRTDLLGSATFLAKLQRSLDPELPADARLPRGADCGAGIGRVTAGLLSKVCAVVDIVEPVEKFAVQVRGQKMAGSGRVEEVYVTGLESWEPEHQYDLMWHQWCLGHLTDVQLVEYLQRCTRALKDGGLVVIKENMSTDRDGMDTFDRLDNSVTRTDEKYRKLIEESGLSVVKTQLQAGFPQGLLPVRFYALRRPAANRG